MSERSAAAPDVASTSIDSAPSDRARRSRHLLALPLVSIVALVSLGLLPSVRASASVVWSFLAAAALLGLWLAWLLAVVGRRGRTLLVQVDLRKQHYLQACAQGAVLLYWGFYWREVYRSAHLIAAQLLFAYAFDMLLAWSRRDTYTLGFAPVPVILSTNLFLWFRAEWFYLQFLLVAVGFAAKDLIRWDKDGRRVHIFNPSSFPLGLCALALIVTGSTDMTWGQDIAATLNNPPNIYLMIFLVGLTGQFLFGVTTMTMSAVVTTYVFGLIYFAATSTYYFVDSYIPIAVFLGMHLLFTDPSTSPRSELGRILFGMLYGLGVVALYYVLGRIGAPTFYDKLMAVPLMNLAIKAIDRLAQGPLGWLDPAALGRALTGRMRNLAYIGIWTVVFVAMSAAQAVGDTHRGQWVTFWLRACEEDRPNACRQAARLASAYCTAGSPWACNEYGVLVQPTLRPAVAARAFARACALGLSAGCDNLDPHVAERPRRVPPGDVDYFIVVRGAKGRRSDLASLPPVELHRRACVQGFVDGCRKACEEGDSSACQEGERLGFDPEEIGPGASGGSPGITRSAAPTRGRSATRARRAPRSILRW